MAVDAWHVFTSTTSALNSVPRKREDTSSCTQDWDGRVGGGGERNENQCTVNHERTTAMSAHMLTLGHTTFIHERSCA